MQQVLNGSLSPAVAAVATVATVAAAGPGYWK